MGVEIRESAKVTDFIVREGRVAGVMSAGSKIEADAVVSTVHVWSLPLFKGLGLKLPIKHFVHQRYVSAPFETPFAFPPVNADPFGGYIRPAAGNRLLLGIETSDREEWRVESTDFLMTECTAPEDLCAGAVNRFSELIPAVTQAKWELFPKVGLISFSMDGEPIVGPVSELPGLFLGVSFHSGGFSYNPVVGLLLAELVAEGKTFMDISAFSPNRFSREQVEAHLSATVTQSRAVRRRHLAGTIHLKK
jgi:sarcosine oxidase subunit beta